MKYILLSAENTVLEIIPDENPALPGIPLEKRYSAAFLANLMTIDDAVEVEQNYTYNADTNTFSAPVVEGSDTITPTEALAILTGEAE